MPLPSGFRCLHGLSQAKIHFFDLVPAVERVDPTRQAFMLGVVVKNFVSRESGDDQAQRVFGQRSLYCAEGAGLGKTDCRRQSDDQDQDDELKGFVSLKWFPG
jgi:hypothetical protein